MVYLGVISSHERFLDLISRLITLNILSYPRSWTKRFRELEEDKLEKMLALALVPDCGREIRGILFEGGIIIFSSTARERLNGLDQQTQDEIRKEINWLIQNIASQDVRNQLRQLDAIIYVD